MIPYFRMEYLKAIPYPAANTCLALTLTLTLTPPPPPHPSPRSRACEPPLKKNPPMGQKSLVIKWPNFCFGISFLIYLTLIKSRTFKHFRSILVTHESRRFFQWLEDKQANEGISVNEIAYMYFICYCKFQVLTYRHFCGFSLLLVCIFQFLH